MSLQQKSRESRPVVREAVAQYHMYRTRLTLPFLFCTLIVSVTRCIMQRIGCCIMRSNAAIIEMFIQATSSSMSKP